MTAAPGPRPVPAPHPEARAGIAAMVTACLLWGLSPIYYKLLAHVPATEVLAHRTLWSLPFFLALLALQGRLGAFRAALGDAAMVRRIAMASAVISVNWFLFIYAVQVGRTTETSLGYYIFPLVAVLLGMVLFGERLGRARLVAVALAACAVAILALGLGALPWLSLTLAVSFGLYGVLKKRLALGPVLSVAAEVTLLAPLAVLWLAWLHVGPDAAGHVVAGQGAFRLDDPLTAVLLIGSGPLTALPLILFSHASQRVALSTIGLLQYLNPTLQFMCAVVIFGEPFTPVHAAAFGLIWLALMIYSVAASRSSGASASRRISMTASGDAPVVTKSRSDPSAKP